jgi:uncharacterized protein YjbI with pentapeptide repeats
MSECSVNNCDLNSYVNDKCILHCEKHSYQTDWNNVGFLNAFYDALLKLIITDLSGRITADDGADKGAIESYFKGDLELHYSEEQIELVQTFMSSQLMVFDHIFFPARDERDHFDYLRLLKKIPKIHFNFCEFQISALPLEEIEYFFQDCIFHNYWSLYNLKVLENVDNVLYQGCTFHNDVTTSAGEEKKLTLDASQFTDCHLNTISFEDTIFKAAIFNNSKGFRWEIENLTISDCTIEDKFILNNHKIPHFNIYDTVFNGKLEFKKSSSEEFKVINSNFYGLIDFYNSRFEIFYVNKSIFSEFVGFEYCTFGLPREQKSKDYCATFEYATFLSFINLRNAIFYSGLDMSDANLKESPNFLGAEIDLFNTNRETFRIIKYSFDKVGNTVEANKYFSYEMYKVGKETSFSNEPAKKTMLLINFFISNFGQSYIFPLLWIVLLMLLNAQVLEWYSTYCAFENNANVICRINNSLNSLVKNIIPFKRFLTEGMEFISLMFLIAYSTFIYHFIIAAKRMTKR